MEAVYWEKREERREEREESFVVCAEKLGPCREIEMPMRWILLTRLHLLLQLALKAFRVSRYLMGMAVPDGVKGSVQTLHLSSNTPHVLLSIVNVNDICMDKRIRCGRGRAL